MAQRELGCLAREVSHLGAPLGREGPPTHEQGHVGDEQRVGDDLGDPDRGRTGDDGREQCHHDRGSECQQDVAATTLGWAHHRRARGATAGRAVPRGRRLWDRRDRARCRVATGATDDAKTLAEVADGVRAAAFGACAEQRWHEHRRPQQPKNHENRNGQAPRRPFVSRKLTRQIKRAGDARRRRQPSALDRESQTAARLRRQENRCRSGRGPDSDPRHVFCGGRRPHGEFDAPWWYHRAQRSKSPGSSSGERRHTPERPPVFSHRASGPMVMARSMDLHMS